MEKKTSKSFRILLQVLEVLEIFTVYLYMYLLIDLCCMNHISCLFKDRNSCCFVTKHDKDSNHTIIVQKSKMFTQVQIC